MRFSRQDKILELISEYEIETQETLAEKLAESGFQITQATISRDIKELQLIKTLSPSGKYIYASPRPSLHANAPDRYRKIFRNTVSSIASAGNIIVLKTLSGCASAAGEAFDFIGAEGVIGSLAGDNTVFIVVDLPEHVPAIVKKFNGFLNNPDYMTEQ